MRELTLGSRAFMHSHSFALLSEHDSQKYDVALELSPTRRRNNEHTLHALCLRFRLFPSPRHSSVSVAVCCDCGPRRGFDTGVPVLVSREISRKSPGVAAKSCSCSAVIKSARFRGLEPVSLRHYAYAM